MSFWGCPVVTQPFLNVRDVGLVAPNGQPLLCNVSFDLEQGATLAIAGPNGAGKTSLLTVLAGLVRPNSGSVLLRGKAVNQLSAQEKAREIAVVSQQEQPDGRLTLRDYVALGQIPIWHLHAAREHARALDDVLDLTGLAGLAGKPMAQLSGGERQRAYIARALAQRPQLLFLDEPTNHLDPDAKGRMLSLIANLGITIVTILHDLVLIPEFTTHLALMQDARLVGFGPVESVLTPESVLHTFGVRYLQLPHEGRLVPALDIRKTPPSFTPPRKEHP